MNKNIEVHVCCNNIVLTMLLLKQSISQQAESQSRENG